MIKLLWDWLKSPGVMAVFALAGFGLAIYTGFFYERKPELTISVDAPYRVFDLHKPVGGLEVSYAGENLRTSKKTLWVQTLVVRNSGNAEIRKGDYDDKSPFGFELGGAVLVDNPLVKTNIDYLSNNLHIVNMQNRILISPVIFEAGDSYEITLLLLGAEAVKPAVLPFGKIAGIKTFSLVSPDAPTQGKSKWRQAIEADSLWVHPLRAIIYFVGAFVVVLLIAGIVFGIGAAVVKMVYCYAANGCVSGKTLRIQM